MYSANIKKRKSQASASGGSSVSGTDLPECCLVIYASKHQMKCVKCEGNGKGAERVVSLQLSALTRDFCDDNCKALSDRFHKLRTAVMRGAKYKKWTRATSLKPANLAIASAMQMHFLGVPVEEVEMQGDPVLVESVLAEIASLPIYPATGGEMFNVQANGHSGLITKTACAKLTTGTAASVVNDSSLTANQREAAEVFESVIGTAVAEADGVAAADAAFMAEDDDYGAASDNEEGAVDERSNQ